MQGHKDPTATRSEGSPACLSPLLSRGWQPHSSPAVPLPFRPAPLAQLLGLGCIALCALGWASCTSLPAAWGEALRGTSAEAGSSSRTAAGAAAGDRLSLRTALLIGLAWGAMSTISLMGQVGAGAGGRRGG